MLLTLTSHHPTLSTSAVDAAIVLNHESLPERNPQLKVKLVDGSSLAVAVVLIAFQKEQPKSPLKATYPWSSIPLPLLCVTEVSRRLTETCDSETRNSLVLSDSSSQQVGTGMMVAVKKLNHESGAGISRMAGSSAIEPLSWDKRLKIATGAAWGLEFLHCSEKKIIYRDFKASNILFDTRYSHFQHWALLDASKNIRRERLLPRRNTCLSYSDLLKPPCTLPTHFEDCPRSLKPCCVADGPVFVIVIENDKVCSWIDYNLYASYV
ncbi:hypothetical protein DCAR_0624261 [Daucus carota subsp. sativus]|uniref:Protein kinase domain-containing protein n=1 Tax=Daucus carota subsp. sativus TaxID=79200 RepID=A0A164VQQ2_DAUCS|nr:hypothetical protein DCAR_0624261 [Daucus carota subsp. sativus]